MLARSEEIGPVLARRGMSLNIDILKDKDRSLDMSIGEGHTSHASVARSLCSVLSDLDDMLDDRLAI